MDHCCAGPESTMSSINSAVAAQEFVRAAHAWRRNNVAVKVNAHREVPRGWVGTGGKGQCYRIRSKKEDSISAVLSFIDAVD
jgi:hypothetical protein